MNDPVATLLEDALRLHRQGAVAKAIDLYREALRIAPDNADACYYLATAIYRQNDFQKAADWALRLAAGERFDPAAERLVDVARVLDRIYGR